MVQWLVACVSLNDCSCPGEFCSFQPSLYMSRNIGMFTSARHGRNQSGEPPSRVPFTKRRWELPISFKWRHTTPRYACIHVPEGQKVILWKLRGMGVLTSEEGVFVWLTDNSGTYFWNTVWDDDQVRAINISVTLIICHFLVMFWNTQRRNCIFSSHLLLSSLDSCHSCSCKTLCQYCHHHGQYADSQGTFVGNKQKK